MTWWRSSSATQATERHATNGNCLLDQLLRSISVCQSTNQSINQPTNRSPSTGGADQALDGLRERRTKASKSEEGVYHLDTNPSTPVYIGFSMAASMAPLGLVIAAIGVVLVYNAQVVEILIDAKKSRV
jgi:hypothetical protein